MLVLYLIYKENTIQKRTLWEVSFHVPSWNFVFYVL